MKKKKKIANVFFNHNTWVIIYLNISFEHFDPNWKSLTKNNIGKKENW